MARSESQWNALNPQYRARLERGGVTRERYVAGDTLSRARGQQHEALHRTQLATAREFGPKNPEGDPLITPKLLQQARAKYGDQWLDQRLKGLRADNKASDRGQFPHGGDQPPDKRTTTDEEYGRMATPQHNKFAYLWMYRSIFG